MKVMISRRKGWRWCSEARLQRVTCKGPCSCQGLGLLWPRGSVCQVSRVPGGPLGAPGTAWHSDPPSGGPPRHTSGRQPGGQRRTWTAALCLFIGFGAKKSLVFMRAHSSSVTRSTSSSSCSNEVNYSPESSKERHHFSVCIKCVRKKSSKIWITEGWMLSV